MTRKILFLYFITLAVAGNNLMAQDDKTSFDKSRKISDQLKNGTAPGMRFAPITHKKVKREEPDRAKISTRFSEQLKNGTLDGANMARGGGGAVKSRSINTNARRNSAGSDKLPSDQQSSKTPVTTPAVDVKQPSQGGVAQPDLKVVVPKSTKKDPTPAPAAGNAPDAGKLKRN